MNKYIRYLSKKIWWIFNFWKFGEIGPGSFIYRPLKIAGAENIKMGEKVYVGYKTWLAALPLSNGSKCELVIGKGSCIGNYNHIYATKKIQIGNNVLTADKVYISDNLHGYEDIRIPIMFQLVQQNNIVVIGDGSWIGENVSILGAKIGENCVIGANAVVTSDIPNYCVAVGIPAYIIKRYDTKSGKWKKTDKFGNIIN